MKRSRQDKTLAEKLELLKGYKALPPLGQREAAKRLGVSRGFLQSLLKNEAVIRAEDPRFSTIKRKRAGKDEEVENVLLVWYNFMEQMDIPVNGPILISMANNLAHAVGHTKFKATKGWFFRWKKRNGLAFKSSNGETAEISPRTDTAENKDDKPKNFLASGAEMKECLQRLALGLDQTAFQNMDMFNVVKLEIINHIEQIFPSHSIT